MKPTPENWPRISVTIFYEEPRAAIDWLCEAFGFSIRMVVDGPDGGVAHSELEYGSGLVMVSGIRDPSQGLPSGSPKTHGVNTQVMAIFVDDADAHCEHARAKGAEIAMEPITSDYGEDYWADRTYRAVDPEGHHWWFMQRLRG